MSAVARTPLPERNLDVLRAIAVLCVLADHTFEVAVVGHQTPLLTWLGQAGVCAFFVHTSLVLMSSLERDSAPEREHWVRRFYARRAFRIYPLAWVVIALVVGAQFLPDALSPAARTSISKSVVLANLALMQDLMARPYMMQVLWTLPLELQMYVALPLCYLAARARNWRGMSALLVAGFALTMFYFWGTAKGSGHQLPYLARVRVLAFVPCFLMGVTAYWLLRRRHAASSDSSTWRAAPAWVWPIVVLGAVALMYRPFTVWDRYWVARAIYCAILGLAVPLVRDAAPSLLSRVAHTIAVYSYGIYLIHPLALRTGFWVLRAQPVAVRWGAFVALLVAACWAAYHLIEKPGIALGQRLVAGGRGSAVPSGTLTAATAPPP